MGTRPLALVALADHAPLDRVRDQDALRQARKLPRPQPRPPRRHPEDPHVFRLHRSRVYYVRESILRQAISVPRANLISLGACLGKFSKTEKFRLHVTALDVLGRYAKHKVWIKGNGEMPFLYGNHVVKAHVGKTSEDITEHQGVVVYSMNDMPLGFGV